MSHLLRSKAQGAYQMIHSPKLRVHLQSHVGEVLILLPFVSQGFRELHVNCMDSKFYITNSLDKIVRPFQKQVKMPTHTLIPG